MNNTKLWSVVALSTTVLGIPSVASAATTEKTSPQLPPNGDTTNEESSTTEKPGTATTVTQVHAHNIAGRQAATLYVRSIPVLTFVGQETLPVERANAVAAKINQLVASKVDANQITASWTSYGQSIKVNGEELVKIDANTILPDTTNNLAQDTLQAANRLRRLLGGAQPLNQPTIAQQKTQPQQTAQKPQVAKQQPTAKKPQVTKQQPTAKKPQQNTANAKVRATNSGTASYYSYGDSTRTANGERFNPQDLTAAHRTLPFGTRVRVTNSWNGRSVIVRINDRGPFIRGRIIDVSLGAAKQLGMISSGIASVKIEVLD